MTEETQAIDAVLEVFSSVGKGIGEIGTNLRIFLETNQWITNIAAIISGIGSFINFMNKNPIYGVILAIITIILIFL